VNCTEAMSATAAVASASTAAPGHRNCPAALVTTMTEARLNPASKAEPTVPTESIAFP
jgi:hypothetical protein